jgi:hypothetical protein
LFDRDGVRYVIGTVVLILIGYLMYSILARRHIRGRADLCPWDGSLPEWTTRRADGLCDYGHSNIRSASHTWRGQCPDGMRPLGADDGKSMRSPVSGDKKIMRPQ